ncbi:hypothetical protein SO802_003769 [Lithocarpus litseifolius]|uniref:tRNA(Phe) 7-[(3-amino-3-carboxypropyl)-4-demethylwyosine(37)-N(4)]-methyltransferase n=1 Tax=Lithocarpus litseifolius TaxID=425828 RepID=A0AAW2E4Y8_9ROSI
MLASLASSVTDKSPKGTFDNPTLPLINTLNNHPCYFTTSSCSGRISILSQPIHQTQPNKKSKGGSLLFVSHDPANPDSVISLLFPDSLTRLEPKPKSKHVLCFESLIVAVECKDLALAQSLVSTARSAGFRESSISNANNKRVIIAICCSIRLEVPLDITESVMLLVFAIDFSLETTIRIKRRLWIENHILERRWIDDLTRIGRTNLLQVFDFMPR